MKLSKIHLAVGALIVMNVIWGAAYPLYKWSLQNLDPFTFAYFRFFLAAILMLPFIKQSLFINRKDYLSLTAGALSGCTLSVTFWFLGLQNASSMNASIISSTGPLFMFFFAAIFLHERLKMNTIFGIIISFIGILIVIFRPTAGEQISFSIIGNMFYLLATFSAIAHALFLKKLSKSYNFISLTFWTFLIGSFGLLPMALFSTYKHGLFPHLDMSGIVGLVYATIFSSIIAYSLLAYGLKYIQANESGIYGYIEPVVTILLAILLLGEKLTLPFLLGGLLVFIGMYLTRHNDHGHPYHRVKHI